MTAVADFREVAEKRFWLNDFRTTEITSHARPFGHKPNYQFNQNLPELVLIEGNQLVAMKRDKSFSPSLFTFRSHFAAIHHH